MSYIVLSKRQVEGSFKVKLFKDKEKADSYRKQLIKQYYDVVILSEDDYNKLGDKVFRHKVSNINERNKLVNDHDRHLRDTNKREII